MNSSEIEMISELSNANEKASHYCGLLKQEMEICHSFLSKQEREILRHYYGYLINISHKRFRHRQNIYAQKAGPLVSSIALKAKILDCGCGLGSESILCGILGAEVTGVDLMEKRLAVANKRLNFYRSKLNKLIPVTFCLGSVFDMSDTFDVIHAQEAISHIDPAGKFVKFAYEHLRPGGELIIMDGNALNPYRYLLAKKAQRRGGGTYTKLNNPSTGEMVSVAQERMFTVPSIKRMLIRNGFEIQEARIYGFCTYIPLIISSKDIAHYIESLFSRVPIVRMFGGYYIITARKRSRDAAVL